MTEPIIKPLFEGQETMTPSSIVLELARRMYPGMVWLVASDGEATDIAGNLQNNAETLRFIDHIRQLIASNGMQKKDAPKK